ncbi:MAG: MFS transporter [Anaerolineales bacterium]|jgi:DHA1 family tetracycline resistance protein-like MFS transporter|nr:MFS transporter [Anaerolineales bacterium]
MVLRTQFLNIFILVVILLMGFGLIVPIMPFFAAEYGANELMVGLIVATYAAGQFIGAPLVGRLSDRMGRRPMLALTMAGTLISFLLLGLAEVLGKQYLLAFPAESAAENTQHLNAVVLGVTFFTRLLGGLSGGSITVAQAYIADITDETNRTRGMGLIGAAFGLGFILGPLLGGVLSRWGFAVPAFAAAGLAALSLVNILLRLPESLTEERKAELALKKKQPLISFPAMARQIAQPRIGPLLIIRMVSSIAGALFITMFTLWGKIRLGMDSQVASYVMAYTGVLAIITQMWLIQPLTRRYSNPLLLTVSILILAAALLGWAVTPNLAFFIVILIPHSLATGVLNTVITTAVSWAVPPQEMGDALGTASALESLSRVIAPTVGGWLLGSVGAWGPGALGFGLMGTLGAYTWYKLVAHPELPLAQTPAG